MTDVEVRVQAQLGKRSPRRRIGAELTAEGVSFRVWAPGRKTVEVSIGERFYPLAQEDCGYWQGTVAEAGAGTLYKFRLDGEGSYPDPASKFQPEGPHGFSEVIDGSAFRWTDSGWAGCGPIGQVIYELHIGTFTPEGTWASAAAKLPHLKETGVTIIEVMPVSEFPGQFGWGYDGVHHYAPTRLYGRPDEFRAFVDRAHAAGIGVILDVVYNHLGPDGNYLGLFAPHYFTDRHQTDWGAALNFDSEDCGPARDFFTGNAVYWIEEFHLDGLRFDATQNIYDNSEDPILAVIARECRKAAGSREIYLVAENEPQQTLLVRKPQHGGYGLDSLWNDDFHHSAVAALTGHNDAYYTDYHGTPQEFVSALKYGYLYQGQWYKWQSKRRGTPSRGLPPSVFVNFIENHDQIANSPRSQRIWQVSSPGTFRAMTALTLLAPGTPMLFQGQEFSSSSPFHYFADHHPELARLVREGRAEFMSQFEALATEEMKACLADPSDRGTFERCRIDWAELERNQAAFALHRDLLALRREQKVFREQKPMGVDGAVLNSSAFVIRYFDDNADDRLLVVNLGLDACLDPAPEPLLAPPESTLWRTLWSSENPLYGGCGTPGLSSDTSWKIPGRAAIVLAPHPIPPELEVVDE